MKRSLSSSSQRRCFSDCDLRFKLTSLTVRVWSLTTGITNGLSSANLPINLPIPRGEISSYFTHRYQAQNHLLNVLSVYPGKSWRYKTELLISARQTAALLPCKSRTSKSHFPLTTP